MRATTLRSHERGFTLVELLVTLVILVVVLLGVLEIFDMATHVARVQTEVADMQQSLRSVQYDMVRMLRMAGRGNLPSEVAQPMLPAAAPPFSLPQGLAVGAADNASGTTYVDDPGKAHKVLPGTDVLTIRGVLTTPVYTVLQNTFTVDRTVGSATFGQGQLQLNVQARPGVRVPQDLKPLAQAMHAITQTSAFTHDQALTILSATDRIPAPNFIGEAVFIGLDAARAMRAAMDAARP